MSLETLVQPVVNFVTNHPYLTGGILGIGGLLAYYRVKSISKAVKPWLIYGVFAYLILYVLHMMFSGASS